MVKNGTKINRNVMGIRVVALAIMLITGWVSYGHTYTVVRLAGESVVTALLCAALPDLLMTISLIKMSVKRTATQRVSRWVTASFWIGLVCSLAANGFSAWQRHSVVAIVVALMCPVFVMLTVEMLRHANAVVTVKRKAAVKAPVRVAKAARGKVGALVPA